MTPHFFTTTELAQFQRDGYLIVRGLAAAELCERMKRRAQEHLAAETAPLEYEADVKYPGAPAALDAPGGRTVRRLLQAYARDPLFRDWATSHEIAGRLRQLLGPQAELSQTHHNCIMTKDPGYSSITSWHRDIRYWSFEKPGLVSVWLALGREHYKNGCLLLLPGSHAMEFRPDQLDAAQFLRTEPDENRDLLRAQIAAELEPGDVLFFHCSLFHAAGHNQSADTKFSLVFTYHASSNRPLPGTRSAALPGIALLP
ncbi:MAG: phytanoyl-CoA dioxygenase family protein [Pseudomonadota bacterium]